MNMILNEKDVTEVIEDFERYLQKRGITDPRFIIIVEIMHDRQTVESQRIGNCTPERATTMCGEWLKRDLI